MNASDGLWFAFSSAAELPFVETFPYLRISQISSANSWLENDKAANNGIENSFTLKNLIEFNFRLSVNWNSRKFKQKQIFLQI